MEHSRQVKKNLPKSKVVIGTFALVLANVLPLMLIIYLGRFASIHGRYFALGILGILVFILLLNILYIFGYLKAYTAARYCFLTLSIIWILIGSVGSYYAIKTNAITKSIINKQEERQFSVVSFGGEETLDEKTIAYAPMNEPEIESAVKKKIADRAQNVVFQKYDNYRELLSAVDADQIEFAVLPANYHTLAQQLPEDAHPFEQSKELFTFTTALTKQSNKDVDVIKEPFTMLMLGLNDDLADSIILASFNPETLKVTMTSIARDSYVPIACYPNESYDKINHAHGISSQCMVDTVENYLGVKVDFVFETDFYALENMVDALGGLEIESPTTFAGSFPLEKQYDDYGEPIMEGVTIPEGKHLLNGKQVVTFARERRIENMSNGDFDRQVNQQYVIKEMANKILETRNPNTILNVLDSAKKNITMTLPIETVSKLMGYALQSIDRSPVDPMSTFRVVQTQIAGEGTVINGVWYAMPFENQYFQAKKVILDNLKADADLRNEYDFTFTYDKPYQTDLISPENSEDTGPLLTVLKPSERNPQAVDVLDFNGLSQSEIKSWAQKHHVAVTFDVIKPDSPEFKQEYVNNQVLEQDVKPGFYNEGVTAIHLKIVNK